MPTRILPLLMCLMVLAGCEKFKSSGKVLPDAKELDAQAIGYACRVSKKPPEACMKENDTHSPAHILNGWKNADKDIKERVIDIGMIGDEPASSVRPGPSTEGKKPPNR